MIKGVVDGVDGFVGRWERGGSGGEGGGETMGAGEGRMKMMSVMVRVILAALMVAQTTLWPVRLGCGSVRTSEAEVCPCCVAPETASAGLRVAGGVCPPKAVGCGCEMNSREDTPAPTPMPERGSSERMKLEQWLASTAGLVESVALQGEGWRELPEPTVSRRSGLAGIGGFRGGSGAGRSALSILCVWRN